MGFFFEFAGFLPGCPDSDLEQVNAPTGSLTSSLCKHEARLELKPGVFWFLHNAPLQNGRIYQATSPRKVTVSPSIETETFMPAASASFSV